MSQVFPLELEERKTLSGKENVRVISPEAFDSRLRDWKVLTQRLSPSAWQMELIMLLVSAPSAWKSDL